MGTAVNDSLIHYIIARRDLRPPRRFGNRLGVTSAQITHAAGESFAQFASLTRHAYVGSLIGNTTAIVLRVPDERALRLVERRLLKHDIQHVAVREPDPPWNGQLMTIGLWPMRRDAVPTFFSKLKLL
jgi:hypothetical protein